MFFGSRTALVTGVTGQDGSILASILLDKGYRVAGVQQWSATDNTANLGAIKDNPRFSLRYGDMTDMASLAAALKETQPDEIYNLAALSQVGDSFDLMEMTGNVNALGTTRLLQAIRLMGLEHTARFYQASTSEMFGNDAPAPQSENTPMVPCSPYGISKLDGYLNTRMFRDAFGMHASNGILFNHESPVRGEHFVTRKITKAVAAIVAGEQDILRIGNLDARRDWGHAADYAEGMWLMLQQEKPDDYVLATGEDRSVRDFVTASFAVAGMDIAWEGEGLSERGVNRRNGKVMVEVDECFYRPSEINMLKGDPSKAKTVLGWKPKRNFSRLVEEMTLADLEEQYKSRIVRSAGDHIYIAERKLQA
jgi:GDPmannose 4,6-dehydratase